MVCLLREKNQLEQVQICSQLEIILTFSRKCLFYRIFTLPNFTLRSGSFFSSLFKTFLLQKRDQSRFAFAFEVHATFPHYLSRKESITHGFKLLERSRAPS